MTPPPRRSTRPLRWMALALLAPCALVPIVLLRRPAEPAARQASLPPRPAPAAAPIAPEPPDGEPMFNLFLSLLPGAASPGEAARVFAGSACSPDGPGNLNSGAFGIAKATSWTGRAAENLSGVLELLRPDLPQQEAAQRWGLDPIAMGRWLGDAHPDLAVAALDVNAAWVRAAEREEWDAMKDAFLDEFGVPWGSDEADAIPEARGFVDRFRADDPVGRRFAAHRAALQVGARELADELAPTVADPWTRTAIQEFRLGSYRSPYFDPSGEEAVAYALELLTEADDPWVRGSALRVLNCRSHRASPPPPRDDAAIDQIARVLDRGVHPQAQRAAQGVALQVAVQRLEQGRPAEARAWLRRYAAHGEDGPEDGILEGRAAEVRGVLAAFGEAEPQGWRDAIVTAGVRCGNPRPGAELAGVGQVEDGAWRWRWRRDDAGFGACFVDGLGSQAPPPGATARISLRVAEPQ